MRSSAGWKGWMAMGVSVQGLGKSYGGRRVLDRVTAFFPDGEISCVMGPSGCGKTTLLNLIMGLLTPDEGEIRFEGGARIAAVFQEDRLCKNLNAFSNVAMVLGKRPSTSQIIAQLGEVGLTGEGIELPVSQLSGGMKRRVAIVRAVMAESDILIMDEPFKGLDEQNRANTAGYIKRHLKGRAGIVVTHDPKDVALLDATLMRL